MKRLILLGVFLFALSASPAHAIDRIVHSGDDLQAVINAAQPGDVIKLDPGAVFAGSYTLPPKQASTNYITIQTGTLANLPGAGLRISPSNAPNMAKIFTTGSAPALTVAPGSGYYKIIGIEFGPQSAETNVETTQLLSIGLNTAPQTLPEHAPHHIILDRCYVHGYPGQQVKRGIALHAAEVSVLNSYVADVHLVGNESQGIASSNGPGPFHIINNYVEAAGINIMFGGDTPPIPGLVPTNIEIRRNYLYKPLTWRPNAPGWDGHRWLVKNHFELKSAKDVTFEGNVMENQWGDVDDNYGAMNLTVSGSDSGPQATLQNIVIKNNVMRHVGRAILISGISAGGAPNVPCHDLEISNNSFEDVSGSRWHHDGSWIVFPSKFDNVKIRHNVVVQSGSILVIGNIGNNVTEGFEMTDNIVSHVWCCGIIGAGFGIGQSGFETYAHNPVLRRNVMVGGASSATDYSHFAENSTPFYFPASFNDVGLLGWDDGNFRLTSGPFRGAATDGTDIGINQDAINAATGLPENPSNLLVSGSGTLTLSMTWADNSSNEQGFLVERMYMSGEWVEFDTTGPNVTSLTKTYKCNSTPVPLRVRAFNAAGYSGATDVAVPCWGQIYYNHSEDVEWTHLYGVSASGNNLNKATQSYYWDAGAVSTRAIASGDGFVEIFPDNAGTYRMFGLSNGDTGPGLTDIDFAMALGEGTLAVYESGNFRGTVGNYVAGDSLRVAVESGVVKYYKNETLLYTSTIAPTYPLLLDTSISTQWGNVTNAKIAGYNITGPVRQPVAWMKAVNATASSNNLYKAAQTYYWDAGAISTRAIVSGDGYAEVTPDSVSGYRMFGLNKDDTGPTLTDIDFALSLGSGTLAVYESGAFRGEVGTYAAGDKLRVAVEGGVVKYYKNGTLLYTSTVAPAYPLVMDTSISSSWANITAAYIYGVLTP